MDRLRRDRPVSYRKNRAVITLSSRCDHIASDVSYEKAAFSLRLDPVSNGTSGTKDDTILPRAHSRPTKRGNDSAHGLVHR